MEQQNKLFEITEPNALIYPQERTLRTPEQLFYFLTRIQIALNGSDTTKKEANLIHDLIKPS